jgi:solute carrier family 35 (UDP-xylose/UDP-N-acetylglucosamine transporter), member B4
MLVSCGVLMTTLSAYNPSSTSSTSDGSSSSYLIGIGILSLALLLSGLLGIAQDRTFSNYSRSLKSNPWEESMFYLHALALPMFFFVRRDIMTQLNIINKSRKIAIAIPPSLQPMLPNVLVDRLGATAFNIPAGYIPLLLNTLTQLVCVSGVNQLTARVSSLTVTLTLVVRKAVSLLVSVLLFRSKVDQTMMWTGAALVLLGTVGYSMGSKKRKAPGDAQTEIASRKGGDDSNKLKKE